MADLIVGPRRKLGRVEFTALLAMSMALLALGIDVLLPAFTQMRASLGMASGSPAIAGAITSYFFGLALGHLLYGPVSDRFGRRPALYLGFGIYTVGASLAALSPTLRMLLVARFVWGVGAAGSAVITRAVIRDSFEGDSMARAMSLVMAVFILVPIVAPSIGAAAITVMSWRWLVMGCVGAAAVMALWARRLPETLDPVNRLPLRFGRIALAAREVVTHPESILYTLGMTSLFGAFTAYIANSENVFVGIYGAVRGYPIVFGGLAGVVGGSMLLNARIVSRFGTRRLSGVVLIAYVGVAAVFVAVALATAGLPPMWLFVLMMAGVLAGHALLIPNLTTLAMAPLGHIAGTASSVMGAIQLAGGSVVALIVSRTFDGTVLPLAWGFLGSGALALALVSAARRRAIALDTRGGEPGHEDPPPLSPAG